MKRLFQFFVLLMPCMLTWGAQISPEQARQEAMNFIGRKAGMAKGKKLQMISSQELHQKQLHEVQEENTGFYVFNVGEKEGFVLVSADDRTPAIIGYASRGAIVPESLPENMQHWMQEYERQISMLDQIEAVNIADSPQRNPVAPLMTSLWNQGSPYNYMCPTDSYTSRICYTGCEATALAQIINYYKYPSETVSTIPGYTTATRKMSIAETPITTIDWDNMLDDYSRSYNMSQKTAIATLMVLCGRALKMDYTSNGSGAYGIDAPKALVNVFGYDTSLQYLYRDTYNALDWNNIVYKELAENRPVLYMGQSTGGGHAFVVDGYSEDELFHVNWGWGGTCDGYFLLSILNPYSTEGAGASSSKDGYSFYQTCVVGAQPPTGEISLPESLTTYYLAVNSNDITSTYARDDDGAFSPQLIYYCCNNTMNLVDYTVGLGVFTVDGELVESHIVRNHVYEPLEESDTTITLRMAKGLANGSYVIRGISRRLGVSEWKQNVDCGVWGIPVTIDDDKMTLTTPYYGLTVNSMECETQNPVVGSTITMKANIKNRATKINDVLYLRVNGTVMTGIYFEAEQGETKDFEISYVPTTSGSNRVELVQKWSSSYHSYYSTYVSVKGQNYANLLCEPSIEGLNNKGRLGRTTADVSMKVTNNWVSTYNNSVYLILHKYDEEANSYNKVKQKYVSISLPSGDVSTVDFSFDGLENKTKYMIVPAYRRDGSLYSDTDRKIEFMVWEIDDEGEDMTDNIVNPDFEWGTDGWTIEAAWGGNVRTGGTWENTCFEAWNNSAFDIYQEIEDLPAGVYEIKVQGFYRYLSGNNAWNAYQEGKITIPTYVYLNNSASPFSNYFAERVPYGTIYTGNTYTEPSYTYWYPHDMTSSSQAFAEGLYSQSAYGLIENDGDVMRIGVKGSSNQGNDSWAIWDNFKLIYHGYEADVIEPVLTKTIASASNLLEEIMSKNSYGNLTSAIERAQTAVLGTDGEEMFQALNELYEAQTQAQESMLAFQPLTEVLNRLAWDIENYDVANNDVVEYARQKHEEVTIAALSHRYEESDVEELSSMIKDISWSVRTPKDMELANKEKPVECTSYLESPSFEKNGDNSINGWYCYYGSCNFGNDATQCAALAIEFWQTNFDWFQDVANIPNGTYRLVVSAFYRYGTAANDYNTYINGYNQPNAYIYMNNGQQTTQTSLAMLSSGGQASSQGKGWEVQLSNGKWVPNDMVSSVNYFQKGLYRNECEIEVVDGILRIGIAKPQGVYDDWVIMDDFRLYYLGTNETVGIKDSHLESVPQMRLAYDLQGRRIEHPTKGLYIIDGRKIVIR